MKRDQFMNACKHFGIKKIADKVSVGGEVYYVTFEFFERKNMSKAMLIRTNVDGTKKILAKCYNKEAEAVAYLM